MEVSAEDRRRAYSHWLRTGRWPVARMPDGVELKFNPYHDPRNGQFTFAPGGPRSLRSVVVSTRGRSYLQRREVPAGDAPRPVPTSDAPGASTPQATDAVYVLGENDARLEPAQIFRGPRPPRGSNSRAFEDPMTLEQTFPGLRTSPGGAIIAVADDIFDFGGPAQAASTELARNWTNRLIEQIRAIDPGYRFDTLGFPETLQGQINQINALRFARAAAFMRVKGELGPLQVETLRFVQSSANRAYRLGLELLRAGKLRVRLSEQEALGNFIDREVRKDLRNYYARHGIESAGNGPVRVNRRENDTSGTELVFRRPDARVGNVAFDVTLSRKTLKTPQVRDFFGTDFAPTHVIIIRPRQIGPGNTYIITRTETKR